MSLDVFNILDLIERLEKPHLSDRIFFRTGKSSTRGVAPFLGRILLDKNMQRENLLAVYGNHIYIFGSVVASPTDLLHLIKIILVYVARGGRVALHAPYYLRASHEGIIRPASCHVKLRRKIMAGCNATGPSAK